MSVSVAVVGGSGFIGSVITERLLDAGHAVTVVDLVPYAASSRARYTFCDIAGSSIAEEVFQCEVVILAAGALQGRCLEDPRDAWTLNVRATVDLVHALSVRSAPRVIFLSSGMVYQRSENSLGLSEQSATAATCLYRASKLAVEQCLLAATYAHPMRALILRPFTVYGVGRGGVGGLLFRRWVEQGRRGERLTVYGDGKQIIDPVPVELVAEACAAYITSDTNEARTIVNVTSGGFVTLERLAELFVATGLAPGFDRLPQKTADVQRGWGDPSRLERLLGRSLPRDPEREVEMFLRSAPRVEARAS